jgi:hypothetical protein
VPLSAGVRQLSNGISMSADSYLSGVLTKYIVNQAGVHAQVLAIHPVIAKWAGTYLLETIYSGSIAKGTAVSLLTDADVFISLSSTTPDQLADVYATLYTALIKGGYQARKQNVSIGVTAGGYNIDYIPGKRQSQHGYDHSLYKSKSRSWTKTNVKTHVSLVAGSGRLSEIKLTKIWRILHGLEFPSFYLELAIINCLAGSSTASLSDNFWKVLGFLSSNFPARRYVDPANTNNVISDDLTQAEKQAIKTAALDARAQTNWQTIVW